MSNLYKSPRVSNLRDIEAVGLRHGGRAQVFDRSGLPPKVLDRGYITGIDSLMIDRTIAGVDNSELFEEPYDRENHEAYNPHLNLTSEQQPMTRKLSKNRFAMKSTLAPDAAVDKHRLHIPPKLGVDGSFNENFKHLGQTGLSSTQIIF